MRSMLTIKLMEHFRGQPAGQHSFDMQEYLVLAMFPYERFGLDQERRKTSYAIYVEIKNLKSNEKRTFYCETVTIDNT